MNPITRIKKALRGDVPLSAVAAELVRLGRVRTARSRERRNIAGIDAASARLGSKYASMGPDALLDHFRTRERPLLWANLADIASAQRTIFPAETRELLDAADRIVERNEWTVGGFGPFTFNSPDYWRRDPITGSDWRLDYHADVPIFASGGPDIRILWEMNRFGHALVLGRVFAITSNEKYAETFFRHLEEWSSQNPYGRGANWVSPMDVIMRAVNMIAAFELVKSSAACTPENLALVLKLADSHCRFTVDNLEFSYVATGNHYITNVAGLFFVAMLLPELAHASRWREFGLKELLRETDKQVLPDGVDWESSTGYHKFVTEMLLVCLLLAYRNGIDIADLELDRCHHMLAYLRTLIRPDGGMPLIGDCDASQFLPIVQRHGDDAKYMLDIAAVLCRRDDFKIGHDCSTEVLWLFGTDGVERYQAMSATEVDSAKFKNGGSYVLRHHDMYLHLNGNDVGLRGRGSHSHNDALSVEISALGQAWIVDPGSYVYNFDREARHRFRSTAVHSTLRIDGREQNQIEVGQPFVSSNDAKPRLIEWHLDDAAERVSVEHYGYSPLVHRRTVGMYKAERFWSVTDQVIGGGEHEFAFSFHTAPGISIEEIKDGCLLRTQAGPSLAILSDGDASLQVEDGGFSAHYGKLEPASIIRFRMTATAPISVLWQIVPIPAEEDAATFLARHSALPQNNA